MKFSADTREVLENFASINPSIKITASNKVKTISPTKTIIAEAVLGEDFDGEACIYDLPRLLSVMSLYQDPEVEFSEKNLLIKEGRRKTRYTYASENLIIKPSDKPLNFPEGGVQMSVTYEDIDNILKASKVMSLPHIAFVGEGGTIYLRAMDVDDSDADTFDTELGSTTEEFRFVIKADNLKILPYDYEVELSPKGISRFKADKVTYYVAIEAKSSFYNEG